MTSSGHSPGSAVLPPPARPAVDLMAMLHPVAEEQGLQHEVVDGQFWVLRKPAN